MHWPGGEGGIVKVAIGAVWTCGTFVVAAWLATLSIDARLDDCKALGKTRLAGVAVECRVIKP